MIMNYVKTMLVLFAGLTMSACAGAGARTDYYLAVQQAAQAQAQQSEARYRALATIANSGDSAAKAMATMAIAMNKDQTIAPAYIESDALSWAKVLATPVATLGGLWIQSDVAKNASNNAKEIQMASFASNEAIQLGQQNMVTGLGAQWSEAAAGSADLAIAGFNALNVAGGQTVELGIAGLNTADSIAGAGFDANTTIAGLGLATADSIATTGLNNLNEMGQYGMTTVSATGLAGMQNLTDLGKWGMEGIWLTAENGMNGMQALGEAGMTNLTTLGTTGMGLVDTQGTNYATIISNMQATINQLGADLADPITCSQNADGLFVCQ